MNVAGKHGNICNGSPHIQQSLKVRLQRVQLADEHAPQRHGAAVSGGHQLPQIAGKGSVRVVSLDPGLGAVCQPQDTHIVSRRGDEYLHRIKGGCIKLADKLLLVYGQLAAAQLRFFSEGNLGDVNIVYFQSFAHLDTFFPVFMERLTRS